MLLAIAVLTLKCRNKRARCSYWCLSSKEGHNSEELIPQTAANSERKTPFQERFLYVFILSCFSVIASTSSNTWHNTHIDCAGLLFYHLTGVNVKAPSVTSISDEERADGGILHVSQKTKDWEHYGDIAWLEGKVIKVSRCGMKWSWKTREDLSVRVKHQQPYFFHTSFASTNNWNFIFFSILRLKDGNRCC